MNSSRTMKRLRGTLSNGITTCCGALTCWGITINYIRMIICSVQVLRLSFVSLRTSDASSFPLSVCV